MVSLQVYDIIILFGKKKKILGKKRKLLSWSWLWMLCVLLYPENFQFWVNGPLGRYRKHLYIHSCQLSGGNKESPRHVSFCSALNDKTLQMWWIPTAFLLYS